MRDLSDTVKQRYRINTAGKSQRSYKRSYANVVYVGLWLMSVIIA